MKGAVREPPVHRAAQYVEAVDHTDIAAAVRRQACRVACLLDEGKPFRRHVLATPVRIRKVDLVQTEPVSQVRMRSNEFGGNRPLVLARAINVSYGMRADRESAVAQ